MVTTIIPFAFVGKIRGGMLVLITLKIPENYEKYDNPN